MGYSEFKPHEWNCNIADELAIIVERELQWQPRSLPPAQVSLITLMPQSYSQFLNLHNSNSSPFSIVWGKKKASLVTLNCQVWRNFQILISLHQRMILVQVFRSTQNLMGWVRVCQSKPAYLFEQQVHSTLKPPKKILLILFH